VGYTEDSKHFLIVFTLVLVGLVNELMAHVCKAGTLPLEPHLQPILLWLFGDQVSGTIFLIWL
jgi:hypothetical protein